MAIFGKLGNQGRDPDVALPFLAATEADYVRSLVRTAMAQHGLEVTVYADDVEDADGRQFGLWNVAAACHNDERGKSAWPGVVAEHVRAVLANLDAPSPFEQLTAPQAAALTYARLHDAASLPSSDAFPHVDFAPGLVELLALDQPDTVAMFGRKDVDRLGGWATLRAHGLNNLHREGVDDLQKVATADGGHFHALACESVYTASRALLMPGLATQLTGEEPGADGWLLSVPNRHQLCWHIIRDSNVIPSIHSMAMFTQLGFSDSPGPLSPHVYWWNGSEYRQLTQIDDAGETSVHVDAEFLAVLERLT